MKNKLSKGLSLSANPKHLIKGVFFAAQRVLAEFGVKNHTFGNNKFRTKQTDVSGLGSGLLRVASNDAEGNNIAFKGLDAVRQCASKFFKTAESGVDKVVSSCEKNPSVHWRYMNFLRQRKTALDAPLYAVFLGRSLLPQCALDATGFLSDVYKRSTRAKKFLADDVQGGKSMIEMLGVLAIIAVLTVGGIAGYSKAMKKYQANKVVGEIIQALVKWKELSEHNKLYDIYALDAETKKTLGLCLPSAENCSGRTPVGNISINGYVFMRDADAELCISAFNNIVIPLKGNIDEFSVSTIIKNRDDAIKEMSKCNDKCRDKCKEDSNCLIKCLKSETHRTCMNGAKYYASICIAENERECSSDDNYINIDDARVVTEINAACNSGIDKKVSSIRIIFKNGFTTEYLH